MAAVEGGDSHGMVLKDYLEKIKTSSKQYYATLPKQLNDAIKENCPHFATKGFFITMHPLTMLQLHSQNFILVRIAGSFPPDLVSNFFCIQTSKNDLLENNFKCGGNCQDKCSSC